MTLNVLRDASRELDNLTNRPGTTGMKDRGTLDALETLEISELRRVSARWKEVSRVGPTIFRVPEPHSEKTSKPPDYLRNQSIKDDKQRKSRHAD
jgi:hypothetical protein